MGFGCVRALVTDSSDLWQMREIDILELQLLLLLLRSGLQLLQDAGFIVPSYTNCIWGLHNDNNSICKTEGRQYATN